MAPARAVEPASTMGDGGTDVMMANTQRTGTQGRGS
jgi:hypothetical protein